MFSFKVSYLIGWHSRIIISIIILSSSLSLHILLICIYDRCCSSETGLNNNCHNFPESYFLTPHSAKIGYSSFWRQVSWKGGCIIVKHLQFEDLSILSFPYFNA